MAIFQQRACCTLLEIEQDKVIVHKGGRGSGSKGQRAPWDSTAKSSNSGVMMVNGAWKMLCNKGCGWNESHTTKLHDEHQRSAATFKVPPHHPY